MQCKCCNSEITNGISFCSVCGFPTLVGDPGTDVQTQISGHREKLIGGIVIRVKRYCYDFDNDGNVKECKTDFIKLAAAMELCDGNVHWMNDEFENMESDREIVVEIAVFRNGKNTVIPIKVKPDRVIGHSKIGVCLCDGFTIKLAVGNADNYVLSEAVSILKI